MRWNLTPPEIFRPLYTQYCSVIFKKLCTLTTIQRKCFYTHLSWNINRIHITIHVSRPKAAFSSPSNYVNKQLYAFQTLKNHSGDTVGVIYTNFHTRCCNKRSHISRGISIPVCSIDRCTKVTNKSVQPDSPEWTFYKFLMQ